MNDMLNILIVEDDITLCKEFCELIDCSEDLRLVGVTNNSDKAVEIVVDSLPDVIILDLELHLGKGSGLDVLRDMASLSLCKKPYVLITTNNSSKTTFDAARSWGADYIMSKHQENYSSKAVLDFLRTMHSAIRNAQKNNAAANTTETPEQRSNRVYRRIKAELDHVGISPKSVGYNYLADAIFFTLKNPPKCVPAMLAEKNRKTEASIERAMQNAINRAWKTSPIEDLLHYYTAKISSSKGNPTLTEFICFYANKIKDDY